MVLVAACVGRGQAATSSREALLAAMRSDDAGAFAALVEPHRPELHVHCYRMLWTSWSPSSTSLRRNARC